VSAKFCNVAAKRRAYNGVRSSPWDRIDSSRFNRMLRPVSPLPNSRGILSGRPRRAACRGGWALSGPGLPDPGRATLKPRSVTTMAQLMRYTHEHWRTSTGESRCRTTKIEHGRTPANKLHPPTDQKVGGSNPFGRAHYQRKRVKRLSRQPESLHFPDTFSFYFAQTRSDRVSRGRRGPWSGAVDSALRLLRVWHDSVVAGRLRGRARLGRR
jgi:hypothetical protein